MNFEQFLSEASESVNRNWYKPTKEERSGSKNPNAKPVIITKLSGESIVYGCLKDVAVEYGYNYSTLKGLAVNRNYSKKYGISIKYK